MGRLRVGLLTYGLDRPLSGVGRVALELGRALQASALCDVTFLTPYRRGPFVGEPGVSSAYLPGCRLLPGLMALGGPLIALTAARRRLDVVHDPIGVSPFTLGRSAGRFGRVVTIHDAIAFEFPQGYPWLNNLVHRRLVPATLGNVDVTVTDSEHARAALVRFLGIPREAIRVVPLGVSEVFAPVDPVHQRGVAERYGLERPYVLYVGAFKAHKNVVGLLDAFLRAQGRLPEHLLVLSGPSQWRYPELTARLAASDLRSAVRVLGHVPDADLPALYSGAAAFVLPSLHEGFGLPVIEAMACGTPVVCSDAGALREVAGDAALLVDPHDHAALAEALVRVVSDQELAAELRQRGRRRAAEFSWGRTAERYVEVYQRAVAAQRTATGGG